jgi:hypothetical protein
MKMDIQEGHKIPKHDLMKITNMLEQVNLDIYGYQMAICIIDMDIYVM